jgi:fatty-acid desaturase
MKDNYKLFTLQVVAHLALIPMVLYAQWYHWFTAIIIYFTCGTSITVTYHRLLSHKSWTSPRWFEIISTLLSSYVAVGSSIAWVATHRQHHRFTDKHGDPHSPTTTPWWRVQWFSMFEPVNIKYSVDLLRDKFHVFVHQYYFHMHAFVLIFLYIIDPFAVVYAYLVPAALVWNAGSCINTVNHMIGYRNHNTKDNSTCNLITGYLVFGEGWHNNHHFNPAADKFQQKWWEFDLGYFIIKRVRKDA